ncbi:MAG: AraC family transcriptional regulator [Bacteroidota bacterium]
MEEDLNIAGRQTYSEYTQRINRVIDYVETHLDEELNAGMLADIANFSRFHFQRIFKSFTGESLYQFIQRVRLEKAAGLLIGNTSKSVTEIALECGFSGSATFARAFKDTYGISASGFRSRKCKPDSTICKPLGNTSKEFEVSSSYFSGVTNSNTNKQIWRIRMKTNSKLECQVRVEDIEEFTVAYIRHIGPYKGDEKMFMGLFDRLFRWAGPRGFLEAPDVKVIIVYHDNPEITKEENLRTSVCVSVPADAETGGEIGKMQIPGGKYAIAKFEISAEEYEDAWNAICGGWLPESGYQPDDRPPFELSLNDPQTHPEHKHIVDIYLPVKPL